MSKCEGFDQEMHIYKQRYARHNKQSTIFTLLQKLCINFQKIRKINVSVSTLYAQYNINFYSNMGLFYETFMQILKRLGIYKARYYTSKILNEE